MLLKRIGTKARGRITCALIACALGVFLFQGPAPRAAERHKSDPATFARAIYGCRQLIDDERDQGASCIPLLEVALDYAGDPNTISRLASILKDISPTLPYVQPNRQYTIFRLGQEKSELEGFLDAERIQLRGFRYQTSEAQLVENLIKVALFGEFHDLVEMQITGDENRVLTLLLTYFADPRAKLYDPQVKDLLETTNHAPDPLPRGVVQSSLKPVIRFVAQSVAISENEAQTISTSMPGAATDQRHVTLLARLQALAERAQKERLPFGPVVQKRDGSFAVTVEAYGVEWSWLLESYLRGFLAAAKGNTGLWKIADGARTVHSVLSGGRISGLEDSVLLEGRKRNFLRHFDSLFDGMADGSQGWLRLNPGKDEAIAEITTSTSAQLRQDNKQLFAGLKKRDSELSMQLEADSTQNEFGWLAKYLGPLKSKSLEADVAKTRAIRAYNESKTRLSEVVTRARALEAESDILKTKDTLRTAEEDEELLELSAKIQEAGKQATILETETKGLQIASEKATEVAGTANLVYVRIRKAFLTESPLANSKEAVVNAANSQIDRESSIARFVRDRYRKMTGVTAEEAVRRDAELLELRKTNFAQRPGYQAKREQWLNSKDALAAAETERLEALFAEYNYGALDRLYMKAIKPLRLITPTIYGIQYAVTAIFMAYHLKSGLDELERTDDVLGRKQILLRMNTDLLTDGAYLTPYVGGIAATLDVIRFTILALPIPGLKYTIQSQYPWFYNNFGGRQFISVLTAGALYRLSSEEEFEIKKRDLIQRMNWVNQSDRNSLKEKIPFVELTKDPKTYFWGESKIRELEGQVDSTEAKDPQAMDQLRTSRKDFEEYVRYYATQTLVLAYELSCSAHEQFSPAADRKYEEDLLDHWTRGMGFLQATHVVLSHVDSILDPTGATARIPIDPFK